MMDQNQIYVVTNGRLLLHLEPDETGGYVVRSPFDPALVTEAETIEEAFEMAEDALKTLAEGRAKLERMKGTNGGIRRSTQKGKRTSDNSKSGRKRHAQSATN